MKWSCVCFYGWWNTFGLDNTVVSLVYLILSKVDQAQTIKNIQVLNYKV
jgi:hypothetical protein